ncbi:CBS domain-containing protein [Streptomyces sp. NPDC050617]|uniref:CBS domain-containing protein n=1 Tax=Streptomyces sp. NPDC050617 TaxID=3154628 RepID=UPI00341E81EE
MRAWVVRAGRRGEREAEALERGLVIAGWPGTEDLSSSAGRSAIRHVVDAAYPGENAYTRGNWTGQLFRFRHEMAVGDLVVLPRADGAYAIGFVTGEYAFWPGEPDGMRHVRRVDWRIRELPRDTFRPDLLQSLGSLQTVFELRRYDAARRLAEVVQGNADPGRPDDGEPGASLVARRQLIERVRDEDRQAAEPTRLTVRKLLELWDAERRSPTAVARIQRDLDDAGLLSIPPFTEGTLDSVIAVVAAGEEPVVDGATLLTRLARAEAVGEPAGAPSHGESTPEARDMSGVVQRVVGATRTDLPRQRAGDADVDAGAIPVGAPTVDADEIGEADADGGMGHPSVAYLVGNLPSANAPVDFVTPADTLANAQTRMMLKEFSQLPVLDDNGRMLGAVSWTSIGGALMFSPDATLADATVTAPEVPATEHLLDCISLIEKHGFVLVRNDAHRVCGIVTPSDIAGEFRSRVSPFVLIEEVEQRLRRIVDRRLDIEHIRACIAKRNKKKASLAEDATALTLGNYPHLFRDPAAWEHAGLPLDQNHFTGALEQCAELRNDLMHFSPDPIGQAQIDFLNGLLGLLRKLDASG